jgi:hypothetical protein
MREVLFKDLTSISSRKKDIVLKEAFERDGLSAKTERRCFYFIKDVIDLKTEDDVHNLLELQAKSPGAKKRHFYILKEHNDSLGEDKLVCKVAGTFFAIVGQRAYTIAFLHSFKVRFAKVSLAK